MKHFIGGMAVGFVVAFFYKTKDERELYVTVGLIVLFSGLAAWGLL